MNVINTVKAMLTSQPRYKIGNAEITKILDTELHNFTPGKLLPQWDASVLLATRNGFRPNPSTATPGIC